MTKKKWFMLSLAGTALLLIPRRSSRQMRPEDYQANDPQASDKLTSTSSNKMNTNESADHTKTYK